MFLVGSVVFFAYSFSMFRKKSVAFYLSMLIAVSLVVASVSPLQVSVDSVSSSLNMVFIVALMLLMAHAFKPYHASVVDLPAREPNLFFPFVRLLTFALSVTLILNLFIVYRSFNFVVLEGANVTEFKNAGLANELIRQWVNPQLVTVANLVSPLGYVAFGLHFYFLLRNNPRYAAIFFVLSLNLPISSLHGLSRSGTVHFLLMYVLMFLYVQPAMNVFLRRRVKKFGLVLLLIFGATFVYTTAVRFGEDTYHGKYVGLGAFWSNNTVLLSLIDYYSQWVSNSLIVLDLYSPDKIWFGKSSLKVIEIAFGLIGLEYQSYADIRQITLGEHASKFIGLVAVIIYDFGYIFTVVVFLGFYILVGHFSPNQHVIGKKEIMLFPALIAVPAMFFSNNYLANTSFSVGLVYLVFSNLVLHANLRKR